MKFIGSTLLLLFSLLLFLGLSVNAQDAPTSDQLIRFYQNQLDNEFYGDRMDGIVGLGHLGKKASAAASLLVDHSKAEQNNFYRLLTLWALAEIGTYESFGRSRSEALKEKPQLLDEPFREIAARTVLIATVDQSSENMMDLNRALPKLYNAARNGEDLTEKLTALWALFEISTSVTIRTAEQAITPVTEELSPEHGNYTRHLRYIRLIGPSAQPSFADKLSQLLNSYEFSIGLVPKKALTVYTLAAISYPDEAPAVTQFRRNINERLNSVLTRGSALDDARALGPFVCSKDIVSSLQNISETSNDESDQEDAEYVLSVCQ